jgi:hypothetical protein
MNVQATNQLDKVLALADSGHEAEAVVAVRKARQILSRDGLNFSDLARAAQKRPGINRALSMFSGAQMHLETQLVQMRQQLDDVQADMQAQTFQIEFWQRRAADMELQCQAARAEAERWRQLARETVEKLWDLGQGTVADEVVLPEQKIA